jgi:cytochrome b561
MTLDDPVKTSVERHPFRWRILHWIMAALVLTTIPIGLSMAARADANIFDTVTNTFYAMHKAIGFTILVLILVRIIVRARSAAPPYPDGVSRSVIMAARSVHYLLYGLLIVTPILGWAGVTAYPALGIAGGISLPPLPFVPRDQALAEQLFEVHGFFAITLGIVALGHIAAALRHLVIVRDGIFQRMWFGQ